MAENSGFFDAHLVGGKYDRTYLADDFARFFASFIGNGVYGGKSNELMVEQKTTANMSVSVLSGQAFINGYFYENTEPLSLSIEVADGVLNRIDLIVLRWDNVERVIRLAVKKGTPATNAVAPSIQRDADYYELKLAEVYVRAGATNITQSSITDTRLDSRVCGFVVGLIDQFDTTEFGKQLDAFIKEFELENEARMEEVLARLDSMADDNDVASLIIDIENLAKEIDVNRSDITILRQTLGYTKKNLIPYPYRATTQVVNGVTFTDNGDGTITANGTPTNPSVGSIFQLNNMQFDTSKKYLFTDGTDADPNKYYTQLYAANATRLPATSANGPIEFTPEALTYLARIVVKTTVSNVVFKPMIRRAEILDNTWEPYVPSAKERMDNTAIEDKIEKGCFYRIDPATGMKTWLNPPKKPGWEYCTTEMWDNKPVYQMTFYVASLPVNSAMAIETNTEWDKVVSVSGYAHDADDLTYYPFPVILHSQVTPIAVISRVESDGNIVVTTNADASYFQAYITIKYTK